MKLTMHVFLSFQIQSARSKEMLNFIFFSFLFLLILSNNFFIVSEVFMTFYILKTIICKYYFFLITTFIYIRYLYYDDFFHAATSSKISYSCKIWTKKPITFYYNPININNNIIISLLCYSDWLRIFFLISLPNLIFFSYTHTLSMFRNF